MHSIKLEWKTFKIHMPDLELFLKSFAGPDYAGNSADSSLTLWFRNEPSEESKNTVHMHWDSLGETTEAQKLSDALRGVRAIAAAKSNLPFKSWDSMIVSERKIMMNMSLDSQDIQSLIGLYPTV